MKKLKRMSRKALLSIGSVLAVSALVGASPADTPLEVDVNTRLVVLAVCDFSPCKDKTSHWCVDLDTYPYEWHSGCYPPETQE